MTLAIVAPNNHGQRLTAYSKEASRLRLKRRSSKSRRKPDWVVNEVIRLAALMPNCGCRTIALTFDHKLPQPTPINHTWGVDMTGKVDATGTLHNILGIIDHDSRRLLTLGVLPNKSAWTLLGYVLIAAVKYGSTRAIRTDNESMFSPRIFRGVLSITGIRNQQTKRHCPWQNGRMKMTVPRCSARL